MSDEHYANAAQQRVLRTLVVLIESGQAGASPSEVAEKVGTIPSNTTRDLANLRLAGLARTAKKRWFFCLPTQAPQSPHS